MNTYANCQKCGKFGGTVITFLSNRGETLNSRFICPYCLDEAEKIRTALLEACKAAHMFIYKDTMSMNVRVQLLDAIARAEGNA